MNFYIFIKKINNHNIVINNHNIVINNHNIIINILIQYINNYLIYLLALAKESKTYIINIPKNKYNINSSVI